MQNEKNSEEQNTYGRSARKAKMIDQFENLSQENFRLRTSLHNAQNNQNADHQRDIIKLNNDLRYSGFNTLESFTACNSQQAEQIHRVVYELLSSRDRERDKIKELQKNLHRLEFQNRKLQSKVQLITDQLSNYQKQRERFSEKLKQTERDFKDKEEKYIKERISFEKQRKTIQNREGVMKNEFKKKDDKIAQLQNKLRKMLEKSQKNDYKNSFEVLEQLQKKNNEPVYSSPYSNSFANSSIQRMYYESLDSDNKLLREYLRQVVARLFKIVYTNPQDTERDYQLNRCLNLLDMPLEQSRKFKEILAKLLSKAEELVYAPKYDSFIKQDKADSESLLNMIQKMKHCYSSWQQIEQRRSNVIKQTFNLFNKKQKLNQPTLQRITKCLNQPQNISNYGFESRIKELEEVKNTFDQQKQHINGSIQFFKEKLQFLQRQSTMMHLLQENIDKLLEPNENSNTFNRECD